MEYASSRQLAAGTTGFGAADQGFAGETAGILAQVGQPNGRAHLSHRGSELLGIDVLGSRFWELLAKKK